MNVSKKHGAKRTISFYKYTRCLRAFVRDGGVPSSSVIVGTKDFNYKVFRTFQLGVFTYVLVETTHLTGGWSFDYYRIDPRRLV